VELVRRCFEAFEQYGFEGAGVFMHDASGIDELYARIAGLMTA
jgi:hypothetical protein